MSLYLTLKELAGYDFSPFPHVQTWAGQISGWDSYRRGVIDWWPKNVPGSTPGNQGAFSREERRDRPLTPHRLRASWSP